MHRYARSVVGAVVTAVVLGLCAGAGPAAAAGVAHDRVVGEVPAAATPHVLDGTVLDLAEVGDRIVVAGTFTQVQDSPENGGAALDQPYVFAFDKATGRIDRSFDPRVDREVRAVEPGPDGTVYLGGAFTSLDGQKARRLVQVSLATGDRVAAFGTPPINGPVEDLALSGNRLYVGGVFTYVAGHPHGGLVALNATRGWRTTYLGVDVARNHNWPDRVAPGREVAKAPVGVDRFDVTPDGTRMIAIGNFRQADGLERDQAVLIRLDAGGAVVDPDWRTRGYEAACYSWAFDSYVRDVQFAPDGSWFAISTSGGANPGTLCDTVARFETAGTGDDVQPTWAAFSGGDSLFSVEITGSAVYTGGHQRWMNNDLGRDFAAAGAVPRAGISAHDPRTGVPLSWNPGRHPRGVGAEALLATADGLYVGMDTPYIGNRRYLRPGLARFPLAEGTAAPAEDTGALPGTVYLGGRRSAIPGDDAAGEVLHRVNAGGPELPAGDGGPAWSADDGEQNPLRTPGGLATDWGPVATIDGSVPEGTPPALFETVRAALGMPLTPSQSWAFPVAAGTTVDVRLYLADRDPATTVTGSRLFSVGIEGVTRLGFYDPTGDVGHDTGAVKSFRVTPTDGVVDLDFVTLLNLPVVAGIEIVEAVDGTAAPVGVDDVLARWFDGGTAAPDREVGAGGLDWSRVRGAFMAGDRLFYGYPDAGGDHYLHARSFDGTTFGPATRLDPYNDPAWSNLLTGTWWFDVIPNFYRGMVPHFHAQLPSVSSMFFDDGRLYYTRTGFPGLYSRGFSVESGIVGTAQRTEVGSGFADVSGAFLSGDRLYWASRTTGELRSTPWAAGAPDLSASVLEGGPAVDGRSWATRALFLGPGDPPQGPNAAPTADIAVDCTGLTCRFDGTGSTDDGSIAAWAWDFGDGTTSTDAAPEHGYAAAGDHLVSLTVTDDRGASATATRTVPVTAPRAAEPVALRGVAERSARGVTSVSLAVPAEVRAGDGLLLVLSTNSTVTGAAPAGWTLAGSRLSGTGPGTQVFERVATAGDAGATVTVALSGRAKVTAQLLAYSGTATTGPVAAVTTSARGAGTSHPTPSAPATPGSPVVSVWSDKQSAARTWTAPAGVAVRSNLAGVGGGDVATLVADGPVEGTTAGGLTATVPTASARATTLTVVLEPAAATSPPPPAATGIALRGSAGTAARAVTSVAVDVPPDVRTGDGLVLVLSTNSTATGAAPTGWTAAGTVLSGSGPGTQVFSRVAGVSDAGSTVTVALSGQAKVTLQLLAYAGTSSSGPVTSVTGLARGAGASHPTPSVPAAAGSWVVSVWSDKQSAARAWSAPDGVTVRSALDGVGSGDVATLVADSGAPVGAGPSGGRTATVPTASTRAATLSIVLAPEA